jgi:hypothetical protein
MACLGCSPLSLKMMRNVTKISREILTTLHYFQWMDGYGKWRRHISFIGKIVVILEMVMIIKYCF